MASQIMQWFTGYELFVAVGLGATLIVSLAAIACRMIRSAAGQAAVWRIATVSMFLLLVFALTGFGQAVAQLGRQWTARQAESRVTEAVPRQPPDGSSTILAESDSSSAVFVVPPSGETKDFRLKPALRTPAATESVGVPPLGGMDHERQLKPELQPPPPSQANWPVTIWVAGTAATLCWLIAGQIAAGRFRRRCSVLNDGELDERFADLRPTFAISRPVVLLSSPRTTSPVVLGGRRPALVLPANFTHDFDRRQQDAILAHELAHLAAHDAGWQAAGQILCAILWWHPLVWWSRRQLRAAHEALADEGSLIVPDGPRILAEALVALGQRLARPQPRFGLSLGGGQFRSGQFRSGLGRRVERLLCLPQRPWRAPRRTRMAFAHFSLPALVALAAVSIGTAWRRPRPLLPEERRQ